MTDTTTELVSALASLSLHSGSSDLSDPAVLQLSSPPFRFLALPAEIRLRIYENLLALPDVIDLDPKNFRQIAPRLRIFYVSKQIHNEASHIFYSTNTFRLFPVHGRFFHTKRPLLARLPERYRKLVAKLELRLGPGWTAPPACWTINPRLGLQDCTGLRQLNIFIECDPAADAVFAGFRKSEGFYTEFCSSLIIMLFDTVPVKFEAVHFDAWESVKRNSPLLVALVDVARTAGKSIGWGPERNWEEEGDALVRMLGDMMTLV